MTTSTTISRSRFAYDDAKLGRGISVKSFYYPGIYEQFADYFSENLADKRGKRLKPHEMIAEFIEVLDLPHTQTVTQTISMVVPQAQTIFDVALSVHRNKINQQQSYLSKVASSETEAEAMKRTGLSQSTVNIYRKMVNVRKETLKNRAAGKGVDHRATFPDITLGHMHQLLREFNNVLPNNPEALDAIDEKFKLYPGTAAWMITHPLAVNVLLNHRWPKINFTYNEYMHPTILAEKLGLNRANLYAAIDSIAYNLSSVMRITDIEAYLKTKHRGKKKKFPTLELTEKVETADATQEVAVFNPDDHEDDDAVWIANLIQDITDTHDRIEAAIEKVEGRIGGLYAKLSTLESRLSKTEERRTEVARDFHEDMLALRAFLKEATVMKATQPSAFSRAVSRIRGRSLNGQQSTSGK